MSMSLVRQNATTLVSLATVTLLPLVVGSGLAVVLYSNAERMRHLTVGQALLYFATASIMTALALTPASFAALATGFLLGWPGFPGVVVSYAVAALFGYIVARWIDRGKLMAFLGRFPKTTLVLEALRSQSWGLIILTRISPVLPFALMTFVLSIMNVEPRRFLLASLVGMLPRTLFFFWVGTQAQSLIAALQGPDQVAGGQVLIVATAFASLSGLSFLLHRALKRAAQRPA
jgi:uncharacterized membrane protein YdjX (TVP38/TMEM64 family)